jgi:hypothetical protein
MKKLIILLLILFISACASIPTEFYFKNTSTPLQQLDSLGIANQIQIKDTLYWEQSFLFLDEEVYKTYLYSTTHEKLRFVMSIGKMPNDSIWELRFRKEKK